MGAEETKIIDIYISTCTKELMHIFKLTKLHLQVMKMQGWIDPLYHQTSAQFDEGGAKGLLLNNLGVYTGCQVLFDSQEVPGKGMSCASQHSMSDTIDLSFASGLLLPLVF